jgi:hypothetical protein
MKLALSLLAIPLLLACSGHKYTYYEGPLRLQLYTNTPVAKVGYPFNPMLNLLGVIPDVPMIAWEISIDGQLVNRSRMDGLAKHRRRYQIELPVFTKEYYLFKRGWSRERPGPMDYDTEEHMLATPIDNDPDSVRFEVTVVLYEVEPALTDPLEYKKIRVLGKTNRSFRLDCIQCLPPFGVR